MDILERIYLTTFYQEVVIRKMTFL